MSAESWRDHATRVGCYCATERKPCTYHEGWEDGQAAADGEHEQVGWAVRGRDGWQLAQMTGAVMPGTIMEPAYVRRAVNAEAADAYWWTWGYDDKELVLMLLAPLTRKEAERAIASRYFSGRPASLWRRLKSGGEWARVPSGDARAEYHAWQRENEAPVEYSQPVPVEDIEPPSDPLDDGGGTDAAVARMAGRLSGEPPYAHKQPETLLPLARDLLAAAMGDAHGPPEDTEYEWRWVYETGDGGGTGGPFDSLVRCVTSARKIGLPWIERRKKAPRGIRPWPWERVPDEEGTK